MRDEDKTEEQLMNEVMKLHQPITVFERSETDLAEGSKDLEKATEIARDMIQIHIMGRLPASISFDPNASKRVFTI